LGDRVDYVLDGGPCTVGIESTVLDLTTDTPTILRPGQITSADLFPIIGPVATRQSITPTSTPAHSPGQHETHYAPRARAYRFSRYEPRWARFMERLIGTSPKLDAILLLDSDRLRKKFPADHPLILQRRVILMPAGSAEYARLLYLTLREVDDRRAETIWIEMPPEAPEWAAVRDRLTRATTPAPLM
jgi:L-threonylcarbamoyladenylate synthase